MGNYLVDEQPYEWDDEFEPYFEEETAVSSYDYPLSDEPLLDPESIHIVGLAFFILLIYVALNSVWAGRTAPPPQQPAATPFATPLPTAVLPDPNLVVSPYDEYWVTQGPHGASYGHMAVDIAAGKGSPIYSPIHGTVTAVYTDEYSNPTLVIENSRYIVTMLHGVYTVTQGQRLAAGETVGSEGNFGYTTDMNGVRCTNRDCGYHTHLNIYDKQLRGNINPLTVLP